MRDGYVATTVEAIAAEADVSAKTVYDAFVTKAGLLRALWDLRLKDTTSDAPVAALPRYLEILDEADPRRMVATLVRNSTVVKQRIGGILRVIRDAAAVDADSGELWRLIRKDFHANQRVLVEAMAKRAGLRAGLSVDKATDILWMLNNPDTWLMLHDERGWSPAEFEEWFVETASQQLLK